MRADGFKLQAAAHRGLTEVNRTVTEGPTLQSGERELARSACATDSSGDAMTQKIPETLPDYDRTLVIERPDGFYWQSKEDGREYGPFASLVEAVADMQAAEETSYEPGESLQEAEAEIGIADWIDTDTGVPAEESVPRIEDH